MRIVIVMWRRLRERMRMRNLMTIAMLLIEIGLNI